MKRIIVFSLLLFLVILSGCKKEDLCNKEAREWAEKHVAQYEIAPRTEFVALPWTRQRSVYSRLSPEKKVRLWKEKVALVKNESKYPLEIIQEFEDLFELLSPECYLDEPNEKLSLFENAAVIWRERMENVYHLPHEDIHFLAYKWLTEEEYLDAKALDSPVLTKGAPQYSSDEGDNPLCECTDWHDCPQFGCDTKDTKCREPEKTCGVGGIYVCTYMCSR